MMLLVALGIISSFAVVAAEEAEIIDHGAPAPPLNRSRISLPPEHVPYFLYNNKRVAKQCRLDPLCPFKVRCATRRQLEAFLSVLLYYQENLLEPFYCQVP